MNERVLLAWLHRDRFLKRAEQRVVGRIQVLNGAFHAGKVDAAMPLGYTILLNHNLALRGSSDHILPFLQQARRSLEHPSQEAQPRVHRRFVLHHHRCRSCRSITTGVVDHQLDHQLDHPGHSLTISVAHQVPGRQNLTSKNSCKGPEEQSSPLPIIVALSPTIVTFILVGH